ncbi:MAG: L,D-transpeptidase [Rhizobiaceae bacterium]
MENLQASDKPVQFNRRQLFSGAAALASLAFSGCAIQAPRLGRFQDQSRTPPPEPTLPAYQDSYTQMYGARPDELFPLPAIDLAKLDPQYLRTVVQYSGYEQPGTLIVDTSTRHLYLVREGASAIRYGVGIGKAGFEWSGRGVIQWKQKWPKWTPPDEMVARKPELAKFSSDNGGMPPGLDNPLGSRALYIFANGADTLFRVHGTPEYWTIGKPVSSGCIRMINQDVMDLYDRVPNGSPIMVV